MKNILKYIALATALGLATAAHATVNMAYWNFNSSSSATTGTYDAITTLAVTSGSGILQLSATAGVAVFGGTVTNLLDPDPDGTGRGVALAIQGGPSLANNGSNMTFTLDLTGLEGLVLSFAAQRTTTGFNSTEVSYSIDGGSEYVGFGSIPLFETGMGTTTAVPAAIRTVDFSSIDSQIAGLSDVRIRLTFDGATGDTGNNRFDNVVFTAVPEPSTIAALLGLAALGFVLYRRRSA